jgi:acetate CoA/acetoacetate CoA-transferase beta subunit
MSESTPISPHRASALDDVVHHRARLGILTVPGGSMHLVVGARKVIVAMKHTQKSAPKILKKCTLPLTALNCVDLIVTEMGVMAYGDGALLEEINAAFTVAELITATVAELVMGHGLESAPIGEP